MRAGFLVVLVLGVGVACGGQPPAASPDTEEGVPEERGGPTPEPVVNNPDQSGSEPPTKTPDASAPETPAPSPAACEPGHTELATAPDQSPILGSSPGGGILVFERHLFEVASRRTISMGGVRSQLIAFTPDEQRAFFLTEYDTHSGPPRLFEVRLANGAIRLLRAGGFSIIRATQNASALIGMTHDREVVVIYPDTGEVRNLGPNNSTWVHTSDNIHYAFWSGSSLVLVDTERREEARLGPVRASSLMPGNRAALFSDEQNGLWGWRPGAQPVLLGYSKQATVQGVVLIPPEWKRPWGALLIDDSGVARLWDVETGNVQVLGTNVLFAQLSPSGRLAYVHERTGTEHNVLRILDLASGTTQQLETRADLVHGTFSASGRYVVFWEKESLPDDRSRGWLRLWDLKHGKEVALSRQPNAYEDQGCMAQFVRDESVLHAMCNDAEEVLFSTATGQELFATRRSVVPAEGTYSFWGRDGIFYMRQGAYMGPPDAALWAWDPRTKTETFLGQRTHSMCFAGDVHVYGRDKLDYDTPVTLRGWHVKSAEGWTIAERVLWAECIQGPEVLFTQKDDGSNSWESRYTLGWTNVDTRATQRLAGDVESHHVTDDTIFYTTARGLCAVPRADTSHGSPER